MCRIVTKSMSHVTIKRHKSQTYDMDWVAILSTDFLPYIYIYINLNQPLNRWGLFYKPLSALNNLS